MSDASKDVERFLASCAPPKQGTQSRYVSPQKHEGYMPIGFHVLDGVGHMTGIKNMLGRSTLQDAQSICASGLPGVTDPIIRNDYAALAECCVRTCAAFVALATQNFDQPIDITVLNFVRDILAEGTSHLGRLRHLKVFAAQDKEATDTKLQFSAGIISTASLLKVLGDASEQQKLPPSVLTVLKGIKADHEKLLRDHPNLNPGDPAS